MSGSGFDQYLTVFSPDGGIFQVEYALNAVRGCGVLAVAVKAKDGIAIVSQKLVQEKLVDVSETMFLHPVSSSVYSCVTGRVADGMELVRRCREEASDALFDTGHDMSCGALSRRMGDLNQLYVQHARSRLLAATLMLYGIDRGVPQLWRIELSGLATGVKAAAVGEKMNEAQTLLERLMRNGEPSTAQAALLLCIKTLLSVLGSTISGDDLEGAVLTVDGHHRVLSPGDLDALITTVQESEE